MSKKRDPKKEMLAHSRAKVELYRRYLSMYLNILSRAQHVDKIYIFDLLCGEGIYEDGSKGSPLVALETIKHHYFSNNQTCPDISIWFNDNEESKIEKGVYKVERVERFCKNIFRPDNVEIKFSREDHRVISVEALKRLQSSERTKGLFFIDPHGYKDITPDHVKKILKVGNTELLLFLPASFMYRFAAKSLQTDFPGSKPLRDFLIELFENDIPRFSSVHDFIGKIKQKFKDYLGHEGIFIDTFTLERDRSNTFCLFFFTSHIRGFEKMIEAKWNLDTKGGKGFTLDRSELFFTESELSGYPNKLLDFIKQADRRTNEELYRFGLENGFLPKHTRPILQKWKKELDGFELFSLDGKPARSFYLPYDATMKRRIGVRITKPDKPERTLFDEIS